MSDAAPQERRLIEAADDVVMTTADLSEATRALEAWLRGLERAMQDLREQQPEVLDKAHPLARELEQINELLLTRPAAWAAQWVLLDPAKDLATSFESRVMLLVFGKFNAGKSSLCNWLASRFKAHGRQVATFHLVDGRLVETDEPFQEGATETTSRLQGVCLGQGLVLLDTPGLHSMTPENAQLTRRFTDSADAMLWLSSSTSPGQVQELDELGRELHRHKPLLPVITRSDLIEEDEVDGDIVKRLRNKTPANRRLQEQDVQARAQGKLAQMEVPASLLKPPVSISARAARADGATPTALKESGMERLYAALVDLIEPAMAYKRRKPVEVLLHHLEEAVLGTIESELLPALARQASHLAIEQDRLKTVKAELVGIVRREVASAIAGMMDRCQSPGGLDHVCRELDQRLDETLERELASKLDGYVLTTASPGSTLCVEAPQTFDVTKLHDELQTAVQALMHQRLDDKLAPLSSALAELQRSSAALQTELGRQGRSLRELRRRMRSAGDVEMAAS